MHPTREQEVLELLGQARWDSVSVPHARTPGPICPTAGFSPAETEGAAPTGTATRFPVRGRKPGALWPSEPGDYLGHEEGHAGKPWPIRHGGRRSPQAADGAELGASVPGWSLRRTVSPEP